MHLKKFWILFVVGTKRGSKNRNVSGLIFIFGTAVYENLTIFNFLHPPRLYCLQISVAPAAFAIISSSLFFTLLLRISSV